MTSSQTSLTSEERRHLIETVRLALALGDLPAARDAIDNASRTVKERT